jgi:hypothetical protein
MSKRDQEYYLARIAAEREAAERATSEEARRVHLRLAEQYQKRVEGRIIEEPRGVEDWAGFALLKSLSYSGPFVLQTGGCAAAFPLVTPFINPCPPVAPTQMLESTAVTANIRTIRGR